MTSEHFGLIMYNTIILSIFYVYFQHRIKRLVKIINDIDVINTHNFTLVQIKINELNNITDLLLKHYNDSISALKEESEIQLKEDLEEFTNERMRGIGCLNKK